MIDNLLSDFGIRFDNKSVTIVDGSKCLHPYDNFESFNDNDLKILYKHYKGDYPVHNDRNLFIIEHVHYRKRLQGDFIKKRPEGNNFCKNKCVAA